VEVKRERGRKSWRRRENDEKIANWVKEMKRWEMETDGKRDE